MILFGTGTIVQAAGQKARKTLRRLYLPLSGFLTGNPALLR